MTPDRQCGAAGNALARLFPFLEKQKVGVSWPPPLQKAHPDSFGLGCGLQNVRGFLRHRLAIDELTSDRVKHLSVPPVSHGKPPTLVSHAFLA